MRVQRGPWKRPYGRGPPACLTQPTARLSAPPIRRTGPARAGGCSGFQYQFDLVDEAQDDDLKIERDGASALIDEVSLDLLKGSEIDFVDELAGAQFRVRNPNARSSCGCGVSFSV